MATYLKKINGKFETKGVGIWGFTDVSNPNASVRLLVDTDGHLQIDALTSGNPPNLDIAVSALRDAIRGASTKDFSTLEADVESLNGKLPAAAALSDALGNPTTTLIGAALVGWDAAALAWERLITDASGRLEIKVGVSLPAGANNIGDVDLASAIPAGVNVIGGVTQSGTWNIGTVTTLSQFPAAAALADAVGNPTTTNVASMLMVFNGISWDRFKGFGIATDGDAKGITSTEAFYSALMTYNGVSYDRIRSADALANATAGVGVTLKNYHNDELGILPALLMGYDPTTNANAYRAARLDANGRLECVAA